jgi:hypothetical protein
MITNRWSRTALAVSSCLLGLLALAGGSAAQTSDGRPPANEGICDDLVGATPSLYGLCVAYCEAQDCAPEVADQDP